MSNIKKYIKNTDVMLIKIKHGGETIRFNLNEELKIDEKTLNKQIMVQPTHYAFLCLLQTKLEKLRDDRKFSMEKTFDEIYLKYKNKKDPNTGRPNANDVAKAYATTSKDYSKATEAYHKAQTNYNIIKAAVRGFEQRSFLLQSLSANVREEKRNQ